MKKHLEKRKQAKVNIKSLCKTQSWDDDSHEYISNITKSGCKIYTDLSYTVGDLILISLIDDARCKIYKAAVVMTIYEKYYKVKFLGLDD